MKKKVKEDSLREILALLEMEKGLKPAVIEEAIKTSLVSAYKKNYGNDVNVRIEFNEKTDAIDVFIDRVVVADVSDPQVEISLLEAQAQYPQAKIGDTISEKDEPKNFGRIAAQTAKQVIVQKLREAERGYVFKEFASRESDIVTGIVDRIDHGVCTVHLNNADGMLPATEQIPGEEILPGQRLKAYIVEVRNAPKGPQIILSRIHSDLLSRLFELEVPEIQDGYVEIKSVAREAGMRSKIAVYSADENIDPVGSCVGPNGNRVRAVVEELNGEKIDIINWDASADIYIAESLSPSVVIDVLVDNEENKAIVVVPDDQLSLAIGKEGQNARLAAKLTGWKIDIKSKTQADEQGVQYNYIFSDERP